MTKERLNEILKILLEKDESVETTDLLEEIRKGFSDDENAKKVEELQTKYDALQQRYIDTFKSVIDGEGDNTPPTPKKEEKEIPPDALTTFEDIFKEEN